MYFTSLHGQGTSACPAWSGAPTECRQATKSASPYAVMAASTKRPTRVMILILTTTYAESVISTPKLDCSASSGPIQNGTTYMIRPRMQPRYRSVITCFISVGATQLLVGPASSGSAEQMKVRSSTRATSSGSLRARNELGLASGLSRINVPVSTRVSVSCAHSASEPSHQQIASGSVSSATSATQ